MARSGNTLCAIFLYQGCIIFRALGLPTFRLYRLSDSGLLDFVYISF